MLQTLIYPICVIILLSPVISAQSQTAVDKAATSTISGKVTVGGKGLAGVVVALGISDPGRSGFRPTRFRSTTDLDGHYRITNVPSGNYDVVAATPAYFATEGRKSLIIGKNETVENFDIVLQRGGVITGKVTDADGRPVVEEMVSVSPAPMTRQLPYFRNIRTDDRGIYRAYGIPAGSYTVSAGQSDFFVGRRQPEGKYQRTYHPNTVEANDATIITVSEGSEATDVDITFGGPPRTYTARGRIIDVDTDQPMSNTHVGIQVFRKYGTAALGGITESNKAGEFELENLVPGKYAAYSEPPADSDWHSEAAQFEVTDRDVEGLVIKTSRGASVSGVVILEGSDDVRLRASLLTGRIVGEVVDGYLGRSNPSAVINPDGTFRITGLAAGRLVLNLQPRSSLGVIRVERDGVVYPRGVEIKEREQITDLRVVVGHANGTIRGVIRPPADMELPPSARLSVTVRRTEDLAQRLYGSPVDADTRGHFRIDGLMPGTYEILVMIFMNTKQGPPPNIPPARQIVSVTNGDVTDVTITLQVRPSP